MSTHRFDRAAPTEFRKPPARRSVAIIDTLGVFAVTGILYNHESPLRPLQFISKKIVAAAVSISRGSTAKLVLGSLDSLVDWGYAPDYTDAMWRMLQLENPVDCLIGTGILHSVRDFVDIAFRAVGLDWRDHVTVNTSILTQPSPSNALCADVSGFVPLPVGNQPSASRK